MTATTVILSTILLALILSSMVIGFVTAFWKMKAYLLGVRPEGIRVLYKVSVCLSVSMALALVSAYGLLVTVPGMIVGSTIALLDVIQMNDEDRQRFLHNNRGRYSNPLEITSTARPTYS